MTASGTCLCGAVCYRVEADLGPVTACHCTQCRKITGHFAAAVPAPWDKVEVTGEVRWFESSNRARRGFCPTCGSYLFWEEYDGLVYLSAGTLDGDTGLHLADHIYYADRGDYYRVGEMRPCWAQERGGEEVAP